jgi:hypothetical protein
MLKRMLHGVIHRYGVWPALQVVLGIALVGLAGTLVLEVALPVRVEAPPKAATLDAEIVSADGLLEGLPAREKAAARMADAMRPGLFQSATPLGDKPMADKTIEKIRSQLKLQCILQIDGHPVAYIDVGNNSLKKCRAGESVADLFTVVNINQRSVELTVIGHPITLSL